MQKVKVLLLSILSILLLVGCTSEEEIVVEEVPPLHSIQDSISWNSISMNGITPVCAFETIDDELKIFPYYDSDAHISMKRIFISGNGFWDTFTKDYTDTGNIKVTDKYTLITTNTGNSMVLINIDSETAYVVESDTLPSSYVQLVADALCK